jgi:Kef-type K+ transport system membrane component KefB
MMMGFVIANRFKGGFDPVDQLEQLEEPIYCLFFSLAGAHFDLKVISTSASLGVLLLLGRAAGKVLGTSVGARISQAPRVVRRYLGSTLLPQAGLSIGLILLARPLLPTELYDLLLNAILVSVMINELVAPPMVKWALSRAGESREED